MRMLIISDRTGVRFSLSRCLFARRRSVVGDVWVTNWRRVRCVRNVRVVYVVYRFHARVWRSCGSVGHTPFFRPRTNARTQGRTSVLRFCGPSWVGMTIGFWPLSLSLKARCTKNRRLACNPTSPPLLVRVRVRDSRAYDVYVRDFE